MDEEELLQVDRARGLLAPGWIGPDQAAAVAAALPELPERVVPWLRELAAAGDWSRFGPLVLTAQWLRPPGLAPVLRGVLEQGGPHGGVATREDLVSALGELGDPEAVPTLVRFFEETWPGEQPYHSTSAKALEALGFIGTPKALAALREIATDASRPDPLRWEAAVQAGIEEELGFDEDEMLGVP
ncbi:HEAT repeat domain-containing protein [Streptomyces avicenniae]|uniref:HEAT repeat domain-containing protein n=1 Tax=Streptomyces avicenniae TaxID=500153 RepID=UPI00069A513E|nr:HEAT repeat domain-containing protein [Streptomyces avicenniae]